MNAKILASVFFSLAVIAASVSGVVVMTKRSAIARAEAESAASREEVARKNAKAAEAEKITAIQRAKESETNAEAEKTALAKVEAESVRLQRETEQIAAKKALAADERAKAEAEAKAAADLKAAKELVYRAEREKAESERAAAAAAAAELARAEATKAIREAETLKLRVSMAELEAEKQRYDQLSQELAEFQKELDERERALRPDKTIADVSWLADEDTEIDENGRPHPRKKVPYLAENDPKLPKETRELARRQRLRAATDAILSESLRASAVSRLEKLYVAAVRANRPIDAAYYRETLKSMYPDWEYKAPAEDTQGKEEKK